MLLCGFNKGSHIGGGSCARFERARDRCRNVCFIRDPDLNVLEFNEILDQAIA